MAFPDIKGDIIVPLPPTDNAINAILATIRTLESGGNYQATNQTSTASGAYQFIDSTWKAFAVQVPSAFNAATSAARFAPPAVQDAVATFYVKRILDSNNGHLAAVPLSWYVGGVYPDKLDKPVPRNPLTPRQYAEKWLSTFQTVAATFTTAGVSDIPGVSGVLDAAVATGEKVGDVGSGLWDAATAVPRFLAMISDPIWVKRALKVVGGVALTGLGIGIVAKVDSVAGGVSKVVR